MKDIAIYGAGGFGREVLALIKNINKQEPRWKILGFFDDNHEKGEIINGHPILGSIKDLNEWPTEINLVVAIGTPSIKKHILDKIINPSISFPTLIDPSVWIGDEEYVQIGKGCIICSGGMITTNIRIDDFVILNLQCTVGHDTIINSYSAFMPAVNISGEVVIGESAYVGTGASIINQVEIGKDAIIGAGAVVIRDVPDNTTVVGVPAKIIKVI